jgi:hypothetical protein
VKQRPPLAASDLSSLNILQDLVSPVHLRNSRFVSAPLVEARIKLPDVDPDEETILFGMDDAAWGGGEYAQSREWIDEQVQMKTPARDPRSRWSVDF